MNMNNPYHAAIEMRPPPRVAPAGAGAGTLIERALIDLRAAPQHIMLPKHASLLAVAGIRNGLMQLDFAVREGEPRGECREFVVVPLNARFDGDGLLHCGHAVYGEVTYHLFERPAK